MISRCCSIVQYTSQRNGLVSQVETSPEILLVYRANLVITVHEITAADTLYKDVKKLPKLGMHSSNLCHCAHV
jgi:hypothetical protein